MIIKTPEVSSVGEMQRDLGLPKKTNQNSAARNDLHNLWGLQQTAIETLCTNAGVRRVGNPQLTGSLISMCSGRFVPRDDESVRPMSAGR